jgi:DNA primase large subunit
MYSEPPHEELSLDEFETFALDRLRLLRGIEGLSLKGYDARDLAAKIRLLQNKYMPLRIHETDFKNAGEPHLTTVDDVRKDTASHFILRLSYCRTEDLRRWLLTTECALFKYRLECLSDTQRSEFMARNGLEYGLVSTDEKNDMRSCLVNLAGVNDMNFSNTTFYK